MDNTFFYSIAGGIALVLIVVLARVALRWIFRIAIVGLVLLIALGGLAWWWIKEPVRLPEPQPRSTTTRRATDNRR